MSDMILGLIILSLFISYYKELTINVRRLKRDVSTVRLIFLSLIILLINTAIIAIPYIGSWYLIGLMIGG